MNIPLKKRENLKKFRNNFIEHTLVKTIYDDFNRLRFNFKLGGEQQCMLLLGDEGSGKSEIITRYINTAENDSNIDEGKVKVPVLISKIPTLLTIDSIFTQLLIDMGEFAAAYRQQKINGQPLKDTLKEMLKLRETELIIIDDFHKLLKFDNKMIVNDLAVQIKLLTQSLCIPLVIVGMPWIKRLMITTEWKSYIHITREISYFTISSNIEKLFYIKMLKGFATRSSDLFSSVPNLEQENIAFPLFSLTDGCFRKLKYYIDEAVTFAVTKGSDALTQAHFAEVFDRDHEIPLESFTDKDEGMNKEIIEEQKRRDGMNPFKVSVDQLKAREVKDYATYQYNKDLSVEELIPTKYTDLIPINTLLKK